MLEFGNVNIKNNSKAGCAKSLQEPDARLKIGQDSSLSLNFPKIGLFNPGADLER